MSGSEDCNDGVTVGNIGYLVQGETCEVPVRGLSSVWGMVWGVCAPWLDLDAPEWSQAARFLYAGRSEDCSWSDFQRDRRFGHLFSSEISRKMNRAEASVFELNFENYVAGATQ